MEEKIDGGRPKYFSDDEIKKIYYFFKTDRTYSKYPWLSDIYQEAERLKYLNTK